LSAYEKIAGAQLRRGLAQELGKGQDLPATYNGYAHVSSQFRRLVDVFRHLTKGSPSVARIPAYEGKDISTDFRRELVEHSGRGWYANIQSRRLTIKYCWGKTGSKRVTQKSD
jgi:hypothetical protein